MIQDRDIGLHRCSAGPARAVTRVRRTPGVLDRPVKPGDDDAREQIHRRRHAQGTGRWTAGAPMPSSRTEVAVAELGGRIYVVGGFGGERELEIYDPAADRWSRGAAIPRALHHAAAVGLQGKLYVVGGYVVTDRMLGMFKSSKGRNN